MQYKVVNTKGEMTDSLWITEEVLCPALPPPALYNESIDLDQLNKPINLDISLRAFILTVLLESSIKRHLLNFPDMSL